MKEKGGYKKTEEKAHGQLKKREYYQTEDILKVTELSKRTLSMKKKTVCYQSAPHYAP